MAAAGRVLVVVPADQRGNRVGQFPGEGGPVGGVRETPVRQALVSACSAQIGDV
jgi:hypothetical protein